MTDAAVTTEVQPPDPAILRAVALTADEYRLAVEQLGRIPNGVELGIIGALWSEHCGYKTSRPLLGKLPTTGPAVLQGPGENAGAVDIGDGLAAVFKIESHNHPSAVEPHEGAATGVGGILRDIFTMGARPVALLDSLRFGLLDEPHQRHLLDGVVAGVGGYGNCIGVPTVGGELYFDEAYSDNCLVNVMCVGVVEHDQLTRAVASGDGNPVLLVGADTGRDGLGGATFASVELGEDTEQSRPAVQVGNPFLEKCLMEVCLQLAGDPRVVAMQDLGAAGLTSSTAELAHRGGCGIDIDIAQVARRETGMGAHEVMLSESQERMLLVVQRGQESSVQELFERWDLHSDIIGTITATGHLVVRDGSSLECDLSLDLLIDGVPLRHPTPERPADLDALLAADPLAQPPPWPHDETLMRLLASPNLGSRRPVFRRYDHQVGDDTVISPGGDAALLRVKGTTRAIALTTDGNARHSARDPRRGAQIAVAEAARNISATGAIPLAVTNCLNFGNPEKPGVFWQLSEAIAGIADACVALGTPVISGNVSLYNETSGHSIDPTPVIGMIGVLDDVENRATAGFVHDGDVIYVVGPSGAELGGSQYQLLAHGTNVGPRPVLDFAMEAAVQGCVREAVRSGIASGAHDVGDGGLMIAVAECCLIGGRGASVELIRLAADTPGDGPAHTAGVLFGETQSRFVLSVASEDRHAMAALLDRHGVVGREVGRVGGDALAVEGLLNVPLPRARVAWESALEPADVSLRQAWGGSCCERRPSATRITLSVVPSSV